MVQTSLELQNQLTKGNLLNNGVIMGRQKCMEKNIDTTTIET